MIGFLTILSIGSLCIALVAVWAVWRLRREFSESRREIYYLEQKIKSVSGKIESTIDPLRIHMAQLAQGKPVSDQLIRSGRLYHEISAREAEEIFSDNADGTQTCWLDVRTTSEYSKQHIPGAILLPVEELEHRFLTDLPASAQKIMVYCASGDRSRLACDFLSRQGFGNVYGLRDGLQGWTGPLEGAGARELIQIGSISRLRPRKDTAVSSSSRLHDRN